MKIREMDIYFTVPVDRAVLAACRVQAGHKTVATFGRELKHRGGPTNYANIENNYTGNSSRIRGDVAELIAGVLGMPVSQVFPQYAAAKAAKHQMVDERYYKPFTTITERNAAIEAAMPVARGAAFKYSGFLRTKQPGYAFSVESEEIVALAYEALVCEADRAMRRGIKKGISFEAAVYHGVKCAFLRMFNDSQRVSRKAVVLSMEAYAANDDGEEEYSSVYFCSEFASPFCLEDHVLLRDEAHRAVAAMSEEKRRDKNIQQLINTCFPAGVAAYA